MIVYTVGIGGVNVNELRLISSDPDDEHVFLLDSFRDAAGFVDFLSVTTCESEHVYYTVHATVSGYVSTFSVSDMYNYDVCVQKQPDRTVDIGEC